MLEDNNQFENPSKKNFLVDGSADVDAFPLMREFDIIKFIAVIKRSLAWIILFFGLTFLGGYLFLRYTKSVYKSSSTLKLDMKTEADIVGLDNNNVNRRMNFSQLSGEIELIKSKLIYDKIVKALGLQVSYYTYGSILHDEKYKSAPFEVEYELPDNSPYYNKNFDIEIKNDKEFILSYFPVGSDKKKEIKGTFGKWVLEGDFKIKLNRSAMQGKWVYNQLHYFTINSLQSLNAYISKNLSVEILNPDANTLEISFEDHNKRKAHDIVKAIDSIYLVTTIESKQSAQNKTINFLDEQLESTEKKLENAEEGLQEFIKKHKTVDVKEDVAKVAEKMDKLEEEILEQRLKLKMIRNLEHNIYDEQDLTEFIPPLYNFPDPQFATVTKELNDKLREKAKLLSGHKQETLVIKKISKDISLLKESLRKIIEENEKVTLERLEQLREKAKELNYFFLMLPGKDSEITRIKRDFDLYEKFYLLLMEKKAEFEISKAGIVPEFIVLSPASFPAEPIYPIKIYIYLAAASIGFFMSLILIVSRYLMYNTISSPKDLAKILIGTVLGGIPTYKTEKLPLSKLIANRNPKSVITESLRSIRTNIEFMVEKKKRVISITSTISGEGKTFVSLNLGGVIAMSQSKVLLIDLDMRKPKIAKAFEISNDKGMSTMIIGKHKMEECIHKTEIENFHFIPAGPTPPNPTELILKPEFDQLIEQFKEHYDTIIIDTPPAGLVTDAVIVMQKVDLPIYVVRANYSKILFARNINELVRSHKFSNLSVIINAVEEMNVYGYGYYSYGYGSSGYYEDVEEESGGILGFFKKLLGK